ncbi:MAG TPA: lipopolysaccharide assembly protein LapA domain-containing protein [Streptosporangiaceae bacterium]
MDLAYPAPDRAEMPHITGLPPQGGHPMATEPQTSQPPATAPPPSQPAPAPPPQPSGTAAAGMPVPPQHQVRRTRISGLWAAVSCFAVVLLLLLIFILQNSRTVEVSYLGAHGHLSLGVALLLAAVLGVLLVAVPGIARIVQLRLIARRHRHDDARHAAAAQAAPPPAPDN